MFTNTHAHISMWVIGLILFAVALILQQQGNKKGSKIAHMSLRLFYLLIIATGVMLFTAHSDFDAALYGMKFLGGIVVIAMMEMILVRMKKAKSTGVFWVLFILSFGVTFYLGGKLPVGWNWFS